MTDERHVEMRADAIEALRDAEAFEVLARSDADNKGYQVFSVSEADDKDLREFASVRLSMLGTILSGIQHDFNRHNPGEVSLEELATVAVKEAHECHPHAHETRGDGA